jgi:zinc and cadmium transporter
MSVLVWIIVSGLLMGAIALVGVLTLVFSESVLRRVLLPLVAFSAGSLLGGAFFHMIPASIEVLGDPLLVSLLVVAGFTLFFLLEYFLHWHQCHIPEHERQKPLVYLVLLGDGLHNFIDGLAIAGAFLIDIRLGVATWLAAAAHEIPQELGDFGVLVHSGLSKSRALLLNVLSALTFLVGGLLTYAFSSVINVAWLVPLAAGNFLYISASDLVPEVHKHVDGPRSLVLLVAFFAGLALLLALRFYLPD